MQPYAIWITGLPGSGKTTVSELLKNHLQSKNIQVIILDGDEIRKTISKDLGFSPVDRKEHNRRVIQIAKLLVKNGITTIISLISPYRETREQARREIPNFIEVYTKASLDTCIRRDPKGLYKKAKNGEITNLTGLQSRYEEPQNPELVLDTEKLTPQECLDTIMSYFDTKHA